MNNPRSFTPSIGLIAWLEETRVVLPLKGVECRFQVDGPVAGVELDQIYHHDGKVALDCVYQFPLPAGAAVYRCELHINGRVIRAKVEEREVARRVFRRQKAAGRRAGLVESERENFFTLTLGNVQPGDVIVVRFAWFQVLHRAAGGLRLLVPTCPGVRYIPGQPLLRDNRGRGSVDDTDEVPDASRISPPRIDALHPDAAYVTFEGRLSLAEIASGSISSPSHALYVRESGAWATLELSNGKAVPDCDFVIAWQEATTTELRPQAWLRQEEGAAYALVQVRAPEDVQVAENFAQDVYFLIDRSGSMQGRKWTRTCEALRAFVQLLGEEDRVWITLFESNFRDFSEAPMPAMQVQSDRGFLQMDQLGTAGGTELLPAAQHVLAQVRRHSAQRRACAVLITDGEVGNDRAILDAFAGEHQLTVHSFGIDTTVNDAFLKSLARQQGGGCWLQTPNDDIAGTIAGLGARLRRPVLTELALGAGWETTGSRLPDLHAEEVVAIPIRGASAQSIAIRGRRPNGEPYHFEITPAQTGGEAIKLLWAREHIAHLLETGARNPALALAKQHNLLCAGASFIAWDEAEQVPVAEEELIQPALETQVMYACAPCASARVDDDDDRVLKHETVLSAPSRASEERLFSSLFLRKFSSPARSDDSDIIRNFLAQARLSLRGAGLSSTECDRLLAGVKEKGRATRRQAESIAQASETIRSFRTSGAQGRFAELFEQSLAGALDSTAALLKWESEFRDALNQAARLQVDLRNVHVAEPVVDYLLGWIFESGKFRADRLAKSEAFARGLANLPLSDGAAIRQWQGFLQQNVKSASGAPAWA